MDGTVAEVLRQAGLEESQLHAVAVTVGPGLSMCLKVNLPYCHLQQSGLRNSCAVGPFLGSRPYSSNILRGCHK